MHSFRYLDGSLHCEDVALKTVAAEVGTPAYVYSAETIRNNYRRLDAALAPLDRMICYAMKANSNQAVLKTLAALGAGMDVVSEGELRRARAAGVPDGQLQAQQQRWLAARATAAREAPWAVRDVYLARIAELNGQAREAHGDGY